jgi:hypothetical protein
MTIKNKDGTPYRCFSEPNPIVLRQERWDLNKEDIVLHNFDWKKETAPDESSVQQIKTQLKVENTEFEKKEEIIVEELPKKEESSEYINKNLILVWCLPIQETRIKDELYGEERVSQIYGSKFQFHAVIVNRDDLTFAFWTQDSRISMESIVYPIKYLNNEPLQEHRWWRVDKIENKKKGYLINSVPSSVVPDFSD